MPVEKRKVIALTGATGFLGSHLMAALLKSGSQLIILGRSAKDETLFLRISKLLKWFGIEELIGGVTCIETDLSAENLGLGSIEYQSLCSLTDSVIHCASDTSFAESKRDKVMAANINNLKAILQFSKDAGVNSFIYISTAYVTGVTGSISMETLSIPEKFTNVYEESKSTAEKIISQFCNSNAITLTMIRPSIVYGDSVTGRSLKFNALYFPVRSMQSIKDIYLNDLNNNGGKKSAQNGIHIDNDGFLFIPLKIFLPDKEGSINLIPVDYFVAATLEIIRNCPEGGIFHLTTDDPVKFETLALFNEKFMRVRGVEILYGTPDVNLVRNPAEELFDRFIEPYRPYLADNRTFDKTNTNTVTQNLNPPLFTYEIFKKCMDYATDVKWGASIFATE
jgi:nucleoside-diphosphate-sugar epimerase